MTIWFGPHQRVSCRPVSKRRIGGRIVAALGLVAWSASADAADTQPKPTLRPYRIHIRVCFPPDPAVPRILKERSLKQLREALQRAYGAMWHLGAAGPILAHDLFPPDSVGLSRLEADALASRYPEERYDKVFFLAVEKTGIRYRVTAREWDTRLRMLGPLGSAETWRADEIGEVACDVVRRLFRPLAVVEKAGKDGVTAQLQLFAGEFPAPDPAVRQLEAGAVLVPAFRYLDRKGKVRLVQPIPWTYLLVEDRQRGRLNCRIVSGLRVPLGSARRRTEVLAMLARPVFPETKLRLLARSEGERPLLGYRVVVADRLPRDTDDRPETFELYSDRTGRVRIPAQPGKPPVWLYVRSGRTLLARVPFVPGLESEVSLSLPDDSQILSVEGEIAVLQGELIDTVARRAALMAKTRLAIGEDQWPQADALLKQLQELDRSRGRAYFEQQLNALRASAVEEARRTNNRAAESRIRRMCTETAELVRRYLAEEKLRTFLEEVEEMRAVTATDSN